MTKRTGTITRGIFFFSACALATGLGACLQTGEATVLSNPPADSVVFWPPSVQYARYGDTLHLVIHGLKRRKVCAVPQVGWKFLRDSTGFESYQVHSEFELPATGCRKDEAGLDTSFRVRFFTVPGNRLYLLTPDGKATDSVLFVASETGGAVSVITLRHPAESGDTTRSGRALYRDSTASHPRRMLRLDTLAACEILQTATYEYRGDTTLVKVRLITASLPPESFAPCSGARADSVEVVFNRYNFLP